MAGGEPSLAADVGRAFWTSPEPRELYGVPNGDRDHVGATIRGGAMNGGVGCSLLRRPSAQYDERRA